MAKSQEWFEVPHRSYGATTAIYQVGQVITDPLDFDSALFRNGSFNGMPSHELSQTIRQRKALTVTYSKSASPFEVITDHVTVIEGARIDGKGVPILWQVLEEERIYRNDTLLKAVIQEEEITRHLARPDRRKPLYLVTDVIKVQEIIPEYYDPGMLHPSKNPFVPPYSSVFENPFPPPSPNFAPSGRFAASSASEDLHLPVGFDGRKHGNPFVWKYKLECINNPEDVESVSAERYLPSQALSDRDHATWIVMILSFLLRWIWSPSRQKPTPIGGVANSTILSARPVTLEWRVEHENLTPDPVAEPNGTLTQMNIYGSAYGIPPPPHMRLRNFSRARTYNTSPSPDRSDDEYPIRRRRVARSVTRSPTRWHGRRGRGTSEPTEPVDFSDSESKNILIPYRRRARPGIRAKFDDSSESIAQKPDQFIPGTTETTLGPSSVETISHPYGLENSKLAGEDSNNTGIQESLGEAQAVGNCAGDSETAAEPKAEHLEDRSSTKAPQISANWTIPVLNSPPSGLPHAEYDVFDSESADLANSLSQGDDAVKEGKKWFDDAEYMKKVNKFFEASRSGRPSERAKIAVLDTGLDFDHLLLRPFIESKRLSREHSLDFTLEPNIPVKGDSVGHGTHCTHLILKTCETAEVYVAKVFKKKKADQHTAMCVAKAIDYAVKEWKVDIISMSFAFNVGQKPIEEAIERAQKADKKVLFLAAASNLRLLAEHPVGFPANYNNVIAVFSHTPNRERSKFSPQGNRADNFSVLGEHLNAAFPKALNEGDFEKRQSGTSMATALMAGIAGLVIEFSRLQSISQNVSDPNRLLTRAGMEAVFRLMIPQKELHSPGTDGYLYLRPWVLFRAQRAGDPWNVVYEIDKALGSSIRS